MTIGWVEDLISLGSGLEEFILLVTIFFDSVTVAQRKMSLLFN